MPSTSGAAETLDGEFLTIRAKLIEVAACLDRIDRAGGSVTEDPRAKQIRQSLDVLSSPGPDRVEQIQIVFSLPYDQNWLSRRAARE